MSKPRLAALARRHLESRCDAFLSSLDSIEASIRAHRGSEDRAIGRCAFVGYIFDFQR